MAKPLLPIPGLLPQNRPYTHSLRLGCPSHSAFQWVHGFTYISSSFWRNLNKGLGSGSQNSDYLGKLHHLKCVTVLEYVRFSFCEVNTKQIDICKCLGHNLYSNTSCGFLRTSQCPEFLIMWPQNHPYSNVMSKNKLPFHINIPHT